MRWSRSWTSSSSMMRMRCMRRSDRLIKCSGCLAARAGVLMVARRAHPFPRRAFPEELQIERHLPECVARDVEKRHVEKPVGARGRKAGEDVHDAEENRPAPEERHHGGRAPEARGKTGREIEGE